MKKYLLIIPILLTFIILNSCQDEVAPTDCGCVKIVYDTATFDLNVSVSQLFGTDDFTSDNDEDKTRLKVFLLQGNKLIEEGVADYSGKFKFSKLNKKSIYNIRFEKDGFITKEITSHERIYRRHKTFDYEIVRHFDLVEIHDTIIQPYAPPKILPIKGSFIFDSTYRYEYYGHDHKESLVVDYYYGLKLDIEFEKKRPNLIAILSLSKEPNFIEDKCIYYNIELNTYNSVTNLLQLNYRNNDKLSKFKKGEKVYIRAYPVKNGVYRNKDSKELGEPVYYELEAK